MAAGDAAYRNTMGRHKKIRKGEAKWGDKTY